MPALVSDPRNIRLAMLGMVDGNGHPYSWSAIINGGFNKEVMAGCPYPTIPQYLAAAPPAALGIPGAKVTHIWCEDRAAAEHVAAASLIPHVVAQPQDVLGRVDAVIIATDKGHEHIRRARPFIEAGVPVFIDKPLADNLADLRQFVRWHEQGKPFMSTSCMRYAKEFVACRNKIAQVGELRLLCLTMCKSWERYGIHALEGVYPFLQPGGWISAANTGNQIANIVHLRHRSGVDVLLPTIADLYAGFGHLNVYGTTGSLNTRFADTLHAFNTQLAGFIDYLRTGIPPVAFEETIELIQLLIAGTLSRDSGGRPVLLRELDVR